MEKSFAAWDEIRDASEINQRLSEVPLNIMPEHAYFLFPPENEIIVENKNHKQRIIFHNIAGLLETELEKIENFKDYLNKNSLILKASYSDPEILRFLQVSKFDNKETYKYMNKYVEWKNEHIPPVLNDLCESLMKSGFMYIHGRDRLLRPLVVLNPTALLKFKTYDNELLGTEVIK